MTLRTLESSQVGTWKCFGMEHALLKQGPWFGCRSLQMRRLEPEEPPKAAAESSEVELSLDQMEDDDKVQVNDATSSKDPLEGTDPFQNIPLPSIADADDQHLPDPKTLLECCQCSRSFSQEHGLPIGTRVLECCSMIQEESLAGLLRQIGESFSWS